MNLFPHIRFAALSDVGRKRKNNEDAHGEFPTHGIFVVADGMGGGDDGEVASSAAVQAIETFVASNPMPRDGTWRVRDMVYGIRLAENSASAAIRERAREEHLAKGCGSTFVGLLLDAAEPGAAAALHAGDSRLYLVSGRKIRQITTDHSAAQVVGVKNESELAPRFRNMILRAVGLQDTVELERTDFHVHAGDRVLLCSDGLTRMVPDRKIHALVKAADSPEAGVRALVDAANEAGGNDNVTAVLVEIGKLPDPVPSYPLVLNGERSGGPDAFTDEHPTDDTADSMTFNSVAPPDSLGGTEDADDPEADGITFDIADPDEDETGLSRTLETLETDASGEEEQPPVAPSSGETEGSAAPETPVPPEPRKRFPWKKGVSKTVFFIVGILLAAALILLAFVSRRSGEPAARPSGGETRTNQVVAASRDGQAESRRQLDGGDGKQGTNGEAREGKPGEAAESAVRELEKAEKACDEGKYEEAGKKLEEAKNLGLSGKENYDRYNAIGEKLRKRKKQGALKQKPAPAEPKEKPGGDAD